MLTYKIPGRDEIKIENIVFDYNGTIAIDGSVIDGVKELIEELANHLNVYILTADTYGTVREECKKISAEIISFTDENTGLEKKKIVDELGADKSICIGNGFNDIDMFETAAIAIATIEGEGACTKLLLAADIVTRSIEDAIEIVLCENKMKAILRN